MSANQTEVTQQIAESAQPNADVPHHAQIENTHQAQIARVIKQHATLQDAANAINLNRATIRDQIVKPRNGVPPAITFVDLAITTVGGESIPLFKHTVPGNTYPSNATMRLHSVVKYNSTGFSEHEKAARQASGREVGMIYEAMPTVTVGIKNLSADLSNDYAIISSDNPNNLRTNMAVMEDCVTFLTCFELALQSGLMDRVKSQVIAELESLKRTMPDAAHKRTIDAKLRCANSAPVRQCRSLYRTKTNDLNFPVEIQTENRKKLAEAPNGLVVQDLYDVTHGNKVKHTGCMKIPSVITLLKRDTLITADFKFVGMVTVMGFIMQFRGTGPIEYGARLARASTSNSAFPELTYNRVKEPVTLMPDEVTAATATPAPVHEEWEGE
jgi:hypothetical protein